MENTHSILINGSLEKIALEIKVWGEASWWPKDSLMRFTRIDKGSLKVGSRYRQQVLLPFAPSWGVEVTALESCRITRQFLNGMFSGSETVSAMIQGDDVKVSYQMTYEVNGPVNKFLWAVIFESLHNKNIESILKSLKAFSEKK